MACMHFTPPPSPPQTQTSIKSYKNKKANFTQSLAPKKNWLTKCGKKWSPQTVKLPLPLQQLLSEPRRPTALPAASHGSLDLSCNQGKNNDHSTGTPRLYAAVSNHSTALLLYQTTVLCIKPQHCFVTVSNHSTAFVTVSSHSTLYQTTAVLYYYIKQQHLDATVSKHILKTCTNTAVKCCKKASSINPFILTGQAPLTHLLPQGPHIMSLAKWFSSTNRTAYDFLLEFQLVSYTEVEQFSKAAGWVCLAFFCRLNLEGNCIRIVLTGSCYCCCSIPHLNTLIMQLCYDRRIPQGERITGIAIFCTPPHGHPHTVFRITGATIFCTPPHRQPHTVFRITGGTILLYPITQAATRCLQNYRCDHFVYPTIQAATHCLQGTYIFLWRVDTLNTKLATVEDSPHVTMQHKTTF